MGFKIGLIIGAAAGYLLGAKAGRERYQQFLDGWARLSGNDCFQTMATRGKAAADKAAERVKDTVAERFGDDQA